MSPTLNKTHSSLHFPTWGWKIYTRYSTIFSSTLSGNSMRQDKWQLLFDMKTRRNLWESQLPLGLESICDAQRECHLPPSCVEMWIHQWLTLKRVQKFKFLCEPLTFFNVGDQLNSKTKMNFWTNAVPSNGSQGAASGHLKELRVPSLWTSLKKSYCLFGPFENVFNETGVSVVFK